MKDKRFYNFAIVIYEDDKNFNEQFYSLTINYSCIYIRHDKDLDENGFLKKPHFHFVVKLKDAKTISALSKNTNIPENLIEPIKKSFNGALRYLIHFNLDDKYQYSVDDVKSLDDNLYKRFLKSVNLELDEEDKVTNLLDFIDSQHCVIEMRMLGNYALKINQWDAFRRNITFFKVVLDEHNRLFYNFDTK